MSIIRTTVLSTLLGLASFPALAFSTTADLPRLDFPAAPEATRAGGATVMVPVLAGN